MTNQPHTTPAVRNTAARLGVDLTTINGTGVSGRITLSDVQRAAASRTPGPARPRTPALDGGQVPRGSRPRLVVDRLSPFARLQTMTVQIDVFGDNPLLDDIRQVKPSAFTAAQRRNLPEPQLFSTGPFPLFTSSGTDPAALAFVPWMVRPAMAEARDMATVAQLAETYGSPEADTWQLVEYTFRSHPGVVGYHSRVEQWLRRATESVLTLDGIKAPSW